MEVLTAGYLLVNSWTDWRRKEVDIVWTVAVVILTALIYVGTGQKLCWSGLLPGIFLWLASLWKPGQIGSGDGIVLMGIGWIQGIQQVCMIFQTAILLGGRCRDLHAGTRKGKKKGDSVCAVFIGWLSDTVSLRDRKKQGVNRYEQKNR